MSRDELVECEDLRSNQFFVRFPLKAVPQHLVARYHQGPSHPIYWGAAGIAEDFHRGKSRNEEDLESTDRISTGPKSDGTSTLNPI
jgi:hypothetical protein